MSLVYTQPQDTTVRVTITQNVIRETFNDPSWGDVDGTLSNQTDLQNALDAKQDELVSGTTIKTINNESVLGAGNIDIQDLIPAWGTIIGDLSDQTDLQTELNLKANASNTVTTDTTQTITARKQINHNGASHALTVYNQNTATANSSAVNITSDNVSFTSLQVRGTETDTATVKIKHDKPAGSDVDSAGLNVSVLGAGTASRNIYLLNQGAGKFLTARTGDESSNTERMSIENDGRVLAPNLWRNLVSTNVALSHTGDTAETDLFSFTIPANTFTANSILEYNIIASNNANNANSKIIKLKIGTTDLISINLVSTRAVYRIGQMINRNSQSSQIITPPTSGSGVGTVNSAITTVNIDFSVSQSLTVTANLGNPSDTLILEALNIKILRN
jgi:hypothetical protein